MLNRRLGITRRLRFAGIRCAGDRVDLNDDLTGDLPVVALISRGGHLRDARAHEAAPRAAEACQEFPGMPELFGAGAGALHALDAALDLPDPARSRAEA